MGPSKLQLLVLDEAQQDTRELRRYILKNSGAETWKQTSAELAVTFATIRQSPQSGYVPAELSDFGGLNFREALFMLSIRGSQWRAQLHVTCSKNTSGCRQGISRSSIAA
jgi:plasmid stabilization system protein ParE